MGYFVREWWTVYIYKKHYEATENNPYFAGDIIDYYYGKKENLLSVNAMPIQYFIDNYAYKTKAAICKAMKTEHELVEWENEKGFWKVSIEIIEV